MIISTLYLFSITTKKKKKMGKMKEIFMELQEQYGDNLENLPDNFSQEEYLDKRVKEMKNKKDSY